MAAKKDGKKLDPKAQAALDEAKKLEEQKKAEEAAEKARLELEAEMNAVRGSGHFEFENGATYVGQWKEVKGVKVREGKGKFVFGDEEYDGDWKKDCMEGFGVYKFVSGAVYEGEWKQNKRSGKGVHKFPDGSEYDGEWVAGEMHGPGIFTHVDGSKWRGIFVHGVYQSSEQGLLHHQREVERQQLIIQSATHALEALLSAASSGNAEEVKKYFVGDDVAREHRLLSLIAGATTKLPEGLALEKLAELLTNLKTNSTLHLVCNSRDSSTIDSKRFLQDKEYAAPEIVDFSGEEEGCGGSGAGPVIRPMEAGVGQIAEWTMKEMYKEGKVEKERVVQLALCYLPVTKSVCTFASPSSSQAPPAPASSESSHPWIVCHFYEGDPVRT
eukprot:GILI01006397.1.p1 GENE.GILI01006397.1~~GILI01006397.1.p1  ORF type:complete len:385 (+),score=92.60 GILI01006397.1:69-1223(+)